MEINMDAYECYVEDLKFRGIVVEDFDEIKLMGMYTTYLDNIEINQAQDQYEIDMEVKETLLEQFKDDLSELIKQVQLLTQKVERLEDQMIEVNKYNLKKGLE